MKRSLVIVCLLAALGVAGYALASSAALGGTGRIHGTVVSKATGRPIAGVTVALEGSGLQTHTDASGSYSFESLSAGRYTVVLSDSQHQTLRIPNVNLSEDGSAEVNGRLVAATDKKLPDRALYTVVEKEAEADETMLEEPAKDALGIGSKLSKSTAAGRGVLGMAGAAGGGYVPYLNPPNGQKYWDMYHHDYGTNPFIDTEDDFQSTFGMDVSTGAYSLVRNYVNNSALPPKDAVRTEEFVNYFRFKSFDRIEPSEGKTFAVYSQAVPSPISKNTQLVQIVIKGREVKMAERKPAVLTFVVDVSGSMDIENRLGLVKKTLHLLVKELKSGDRVGIVTYGDDARVVLEPTGDKRDIEEAINSLVSNGSTNAEAGLNVGYRMASKHLAKAAINRVILCTDGVANNGETSSQGLLTQIERYRKQGITLSACGFGMGNYNDVLIEQLATKGDGTYYYIDDLAEAKRVFVEQLTGTLQVIARDAKVQVEFDKEKVSRYRLIGYEKRDIKDEDFRNDTVDGGEVGSGHTVTAFYEVKLKQADALSIGTVFVRYKSPDGDKVTEDRSDLTLVRPAAPPAAAAIKFLSAVVLYSEIMRESYWVKHRELAEVKELLKDVDASHVPDFEDFEDLVRRTIRLKENEKLSQR